MFQTAARSAPRRISASRLPFRTSSTRRFLSTAPPSQKSRSWKSSAARWALAIGGVYYYNTSTVFAEQPEEAISRLDQSLHQLQESKLPTLDSIVEHKRQRLAIQQQQTAPAVPVAQDSQDDHDGASEMADSEDEADQQGAFNPETGEINWDCPCLGGMAHGPCGEEFKAAFSCFVYSTEEPKGMECIDKFKGMQDCFRQHPEMYGSELEDDEDELEEELRAESSPRSSDVSDDMTTPVKGQPQPSQPTAQERSKSAIEDSKSSTKPNKAGDETGELVPKAAHGGTSK